MNLTTIENKENKQGEIMINCKSKLATAISAALLMGAAGLAQAAPLQDTSTLGLDAGGAPDASGACTVGSCFAMEVSPGFFIWTMVNPGNDGGFIVGKNQISGGQETAPSGTNTTAADISAAWFFFGAYGTFFGDNTANTFSDASNDGTTVLGSYNVAWNGSVIAMAGGNVADYTITPDGNNGGSWSLDYNAIVPDGAFIGVPFRMVARGSITTPPDVPVNNPPAVSDVSVNVLSGELANWAPNFTDDAGDTHTCTASAASNGSATVNADCSGGTYTSGAGYSGMDSFNYTVTDQGTLSGTGTVNVVVELPPVVTFCEDDFPLRSVTTIGGGQSSAVNGTVTTTFTGNIMTNAGLTTGGKNAVKICPGSTVDFTTSSSVGNESCLINGAATASVGTLAIGDKLICTNKPDGSDTDRFSIKSGI